MELVQPWQLSLFAAKPRHYHEHGWMIEKIKKSGLIVSGEKPITPTRDFLDQFFPNTEDWMLDMGGKTLLTLQKDRKNPLQYFSSSDQLKIGMQVRDRLYDLYLAGPIWVGLVSGVNAIQRLREVIGSTFGTNPNTIRGMLKIIDDAMKAMEEHRAFDNGCHAPGDQVEAAKNIGASYTQGEIAKIAEMHRDDMMQMA